MLSQLNVYQDHHEFDMIPSIITINPSKDTDGTTPDQPANIGTMHINLSTPNARMMNQVKLGVTLQPKLSVEHIGLDLLGRCKLFWTPFEIQSAFVAASGSLDKLGISRDPTQPTAHLDT